MPLTNLSDLINRVTGGNSGTPETVTVWKEARVAGAASAATVAGRMTSLWQYEGSPSHGAVPGAVAVPNNTTDGGLKQTDPGGGRSKWLLGATPGASAPGTLIIYDRLLHIGGLSGTVTSAQTVGGTLTRYTNGLGNQIWIEVYTQIGATSTTVTASYTDQDGNSGQTTPTNVIGNTGFREAQRLLPLTLAAGDYGVRACASVTLAATTGTAGNFGVNIVHPLLECPCPTASVSAIRDCIVQIPQGVEVLTDACLALAWYPATAASPNFFTMISMVEA